MNYQEQRPYVGNLRQLFGLRESRLAGGKADGVRIVDIHNGGDLALCVAADRCMDIPEVRYRGRVLNYITPNGIVLRPITAATARAGAKHLRAGCSIPAA